MDVRELFPISLLDPVLCRRVRLVVEEQYRAKLGTWAGKSLVTLAGMIRSGDYPDGEVGTALNDMLPEELSDHPKAPNTDDGASDASNNTEHGLDTRVIDVVVDKWTEVEEMEISLPSVFGKNFEGNEIGRAHV